MAAVCFSVTLVPTALQPRPPWISEIDRGFALRQSYFTKVRYAVNVIPSFSGNPFFNEAGVNVLMKEGNISS